MSEGEKLAVFKESLLYLSQRIDRFILSYERKQLNDLSQQNKREYLQKIHENLLEEEHCRLYKKALAGMIVKTEEVLCMPEDKATIVLHQRFAEMKNTDIWSVVALSIGLLTTLSSSSFRTDISFITSAQLEFLFFIALVLSIMWTIHRLINHIKKRGPTTVRDLILRDLRDVSRSYGDG